MGLSEFFGNPSEWKRACTRVLKKIFLDIVPDRKTEPRYLRIIQFIAMYFIYSSCAIYIVWLSIDIATEVPRISTSNYIADSIPAPYFLLHFPSSFSATCNFVLAGFSISNDNDCKNYFGTQVQLNGAYILSWGQNNGSSAVNFTDNGIIGMTVDVSLPPGTNFTNNSGPLLQNGMTIQLTDPYTIDLSHVTPAKAQALTQQIGANNEYVLSPRQRHVIWFSRSKEQDLDGHKFRNRVGVDPLTNDFFLIKSRIQVVNGLSTTSQQYASFEIYYESRIIEVNEQIKDKTFLSLLSALGGAYGLGIAIYVFCFGAGGLGPWGFVVEIPTVRRSIRKEFEKNFKHLSLDTVLDGKTYGPIEKPLSLEGLVTYVNEINERSIALESLIKEFVIDMGDLKEIHEETKESREKGDMVEPV